MCPALISVLYIVCLFISLLSHVLPLRLVGLRSVLLFVVISWVCLSSTLCNSFISFQ